MSRNKKPAVDPDYDPRAPEDDPGESTESSTESEEEEEGEDEEEEKRRKKRAWPENISIYFPAEMEEGRKNQAANLYAMARADAFGVAPAGKQNRKRVEQVKEGLKSKPFGMAKDFWTAKVVMDLCPPKKAKKQESKKTSKTNSLSPSSSTSGSMTHTGVDFSSEVSTINRKRKTEDVSTPSKKREIGEVGKTFPTGKPFFKNFKVVAHEKICPAKRPAKEIVETAFENQFYSIDVDSFIIIIKKQWGDQHPKNPDRYYLRFGRNYKKKGAKEGEAGETYSWDYPLHLVDVLNDQLQQCLADFRKKQPNWFEKIDAHLKEKKDKQNL